MARIRTVKPEFFTNEDLQDLELAHPGSYCMMVYAGLWGHCSKDGVFEYRPRTLKLSVLPFLPFDMANTLMLLEEAGLVLRFSADNKEYGYIPTFTKHQRISGKEAQYSPKFPQYIQDDAARNKGEAQGKNQGIAISSATPAARRFSHSLAASACVSVHSSICLALYLLGNTGGRQLLANSLISAGFGKKRHRLIASLIP